jgi:hypothetical protein
VEDKRRSWFLLLAIVAAAVLGSVVYRYSHEWLMVDRCLSASHGSFDYSNMRCDLETNHPYISYQVRHPRDERTALAAFVAFVLLIFGYYYRKNRPQTEFISKQSNSKS